MARRKCHALRGIARADRPDAVAELVARELPHGVVCASNLEGSNRLQRFELEEDLGSAQLFLQLSRDIEPDEWRADDEVVDGVAGILHRAKRYLAHHERAS
jgi:hypothetical protein